MRPCLSILALAAVLLLTGCVERRLYVRSEPAGADVYIDGEWIGRTRPADDDRGPLYTQFLFYGTREYTVRKPGYQTISGRIELETPWYEYPPVDFFSEVLIPYPIVDEHEVVVKLEKAEPADVEGLYRRALNYRYASRPEDRREYDYLILRGPPVPRPKKK
ncbi:MAG: PEGA domain-containing protein [Planctomycetes bacterium]|nr:PEGA domain-containing protein [Planctomycetota bacterium]